MLKEIGAIARNLFWIGVHEGGKTGAFPVRLLVLSLMVTFASVLWVAGYSYRIHDTVITNLRQSFTIEGLSEQIRDLDSRLTTAAGMFVSTGDRKWKNEYDADTLRLDQVILKIKAEYPENGKTRDAGEMIDQANRKLLAMESDAFVLVAQGKRHEAGHILGSKEYLKGPSKNLQFCRDCSVGAF